MKLFNFIGVYKYRSLHKQFLLLKPFKIGYKFTKRTLQIDIEFLEHKFRLQGKIISQSREACNQTNKQTR